MANQAIALQARAPQSAGLSAAIQQNAQMMNMLAQQKAADRQMAQAAQAMEIAANKEAREAKLAQPQFAEASSKAQSAQMKAATDFLDFSIEGMKLARNPEDAIKIGSWLKSQFPQPEFQQAVDQTLSSLPKDPSQFGAWRKQTLFLSMDAKDQLEQHFNDVTTGRESWTTAAPKYAGAPGGGMAREVPGSRVQAAEDITYIKGQNGEIIPMPKTLPGTGGPVGTGLVGGERGGAAAALQTNPGALKDGAFARSQPGYTGNSGGFATFNTPEAGIRAQENLLRSAYIGKGFNTIDKIVNRYAPQGPENSAASVTNYKKYIADRTGIDINAPISANQVPAVAAAMREFETGNRPGGKGGIALGQPISTGQTKDQRTQQRGRDNVSNTVSTLRGLYAELRQRGGAVESGGGLLAVPGNIANYIAGTAVGKPVGRALGTKEQATRDKIINVRRMLVTQIADAAGLSAQEMNSNVELQGLLDAATDPTQSIEAVEETLNEIERLYGRPGAKPQRIGTKRAKPAAPAQRGTPTRGGSNIDALLKKYGG